MHHNSVPCDDKFPLKKVGDFATIVRHLSQKHTKNPNVL